MDRWTDGRMDGQTDGGDYNIPFAFLKKRGDKNMSTHVRSSFVTMTTMNVINQ